MMTHYNNKDLQKLKDEINSNAEQLKEIINEAKCEIDPNSAKILDKLMQFNFYSVSAIVEYLENNS